MIRNRNDRKWSNLALFCPIPRTVDRGVKPIRSTIVPQFVLGLVIASIVACVAGAEEPKVSRGPLSTDDALKSFVLASPELKIELAAGEPEVVAPVAIAFDTDGSMWVVEMRDYPYGPKPGSNEKPKSRIKRLYDHNHDGRFETATVFADELLFATGLVPWKDGVIVTLAGEIAFFADRNDDGKADFKETWFQGFSQENSQLRANHPTFGTDGFIYVANGLRGGTIVPVKEEWRQKGQPLPLAGFDFRFNPVTGEYGAVSGHGQFGLCFDDYGNRFVCSNRNPVQHVVLEDHYAKRNPFFAIKSTIQDVAAFAEHSKLHPISETWTTSTLHANQFTAACGVTIYRGDGLPPENKGNAFTCDPTGNLVHRETLVPQGATFVSHPSDGEQEFLASTDTWFRPVNLAHGPDGALYVIDMYRAVIEHPDWMPPELRNRKDLNDGSDRGRIWRIKSDESILPQERPDPPLVKLTTPLLVQLLEHRNSWHRETAFRLLLERNRDEVLDALKVNWKQNRLTRSRLPVLWMIRLLDPRLTPAVLAWSETDNRDPRVREQVISVIGENLDELLPDVVVSLAGEEADERTRFRLALALSGRSVDVAKERKAIVRLLDRGVDDPWLRVAVGTMTSNPPEALLTDLIEHWGKLPKTLPGGSELTEQLSEIAGAQIEPKVGRQLLSQLLAFTPTGWGDGALDLAAAGIRGLGLGMARRGSSFAAIRAELDTRERNLFGGLMQSLRQRAADPQTPVPRRLAAIRTLVYDDSPAVVPQLLDLSFSGSDIVIRLASLDALGSINDPSIAPKVLEAFDAQTPQLRRAMLDLLLAQESHVAALLTALEQDQLKVSEVDPVRQTRLTKHRNKELSARAEKLFASAIAPDRAAVLTKYQPSIEAKGNAANGRAIFEKNCVTCHRVANLGVNVGPDIGDTRDKTPAYLLTNILDPNRAVDANYFGFTLVTNQGKTYTGLVKSETAVSITMRMPEGKEETILRSDIDELKSSGQSLMPVGFEKTISAEQMADLISFLKNWRYLDGSIPLQE
ncbi:PVC-type heme-binding CxxCH protein [Schlesneria paludicola]|uniref:PVC-type heme-binding CxxCH protein n=1 Tax=Schlesneria paludicola TaxID=360056 RepID=UPI00029A36F3|nr:PVC-type heme-binding CxxCH protein [Schlesneria paludicola]